MIRKHFAIALSIVLFSTLSVSSTTRAQTVPDAQAADKARTTVQKKIGLGRDARVEVKLRDQTKVKGYVSAAEPASFTVIDSKTGTSQTFRYTEVAKVKKPGHGLSKTTWAIIGAAATAVIIIGVTVVKPVVCDGGAQTRGLC